MSFIMSVRPNKGNRNIIVGGGMYIYENVSSPYRERDILQQHKIINTKKKRKDIVYQLVDQYSNADFSTSPQYVPIDEYGQVTIYVSNANRGDKLVITGPPVENWVDVEVEQTSFADTTVHSWNSTLVYELGQVVITIPKIKSSSGFIVVDVNPIQQEEEEEN